MYLKFVFYSILLIAVVDLLFFLGILPLLKRLPLTWRRWLSAIYWAFTLTSLTTLFFAVYYYSFQLPPPKFARIYLSGYVFISLFCKLIGILFFLGPDLKKLILYLRDKFITKQPAIEGQNKISRASFLRKAGIVAAGIPFLTLNYGVIFGAFNYRVIKKRIVLPHLPSTFNGLRILQISDLHVGSLVSKKPLENAVKMINAQQADIILFTGDLVNEIADEALPFLEVLKKVRAPMGVYAVLGNHDYGDYFYQKDDITAKLRNRDTMRKIYRTLKWELLLNEHRVIERDGHKLGIIGSENWGDQHRFPKYGDLDQSTKDMETCSVNVLLTHDPSHWEAQVLPQFPQIDLTLSGHTHGFQMGVEIPGFRWSPAQYLYKQWAGLYEQSGRFIYVNRGLGFIGYPGRLGMPPEITVLELHNS